MTYRTFYDLFLAGSEASVVMTYHEDARNIGLSNPVLESIRLGTPSGDEHQFDADLNLVKSRNVVSNETIDGNNARSLLHDTLKDIANQNDEGTKPYLKLTSEAGQLLAFACDMLEPLVHVPQTAHSAATHRL